MQTPPPLQSTENYLKFMKQLFYHFPCFHVAVYSYFSFWSKSWNENWCLKRQDEQQNVVLISVPGENDGCDMQHATCYIMQYVFSSIFRTVCCSKFTPACFKNTINGTLSLSMTCFVNRLSHFFWILTRKKESKIIN